MAHVHLHGNGFGGNVLAFQQEHLTARKGRGRLIGQRVQRHPFQEVGHETEEVGIRAEGARVHATLGDEAVVEHRGGVLELLVFHEALDQHIAGLGGRELRQVVVKLVALARDEALGLDLEQRRGHQQKVARHVQIEGLHAGHLGEVLIGDLGDGDGADIHLLAAHEVKQQVEGALEAVDADFVGHGRRRLLGEKRREHEIEQIAGRDPQIPRERVEVEHVGQHHDGDHEHGEGVLLDLVVLRQVLRRQQDGEDG